MRRTPFPEAVEIRVRTGGSSGRVGSYGYTRKEYGLPKFHAGLDLLAPAGTPVYSLHAGQVERAGWQDDLSHGRGFGLRVRLRGPGGRVTVYGHLADVSVWAGSEIEEGTLLGHVGRTGNVPPEAPDHLHVETWLDGASEDPALYLLPKPEGTA